MAQVVPAVLAENPVDLGHDLKKVRFSRRLHIDIASPPFAPRRTIGLAQLHLPVETSCDLHLMLDNPSAETVISLGPELAIIHFEAGGDQKNFLSRMKQVGIKTGVALLPETTVAQAAELIKNVDHVLVFTGHLGYYGGQLRTDCLPKIAEIKAINPKIEVSVDGGINLENIEAVKNAGADILISGGFIVNSADPKDAYTRLQEAVMA